ncbi:MAG: hypothetical protein ABJO67_17635 [Pseudoruegeria sp.]
MGKFTWSEGNQGIYRYSDFGRFDLTEIDSDGATLFYDNSDNDFDPSRAPWKIELIFKDAETYTFETGPDAGTEVFTDGTITGIKIYNQDGDLVIKGTGLDASLAIVSARLLDDGDLDGLWKFINAGGHTYVGSNDSSGPDNDWDGDSISTGRGDDTIKGNGGNDYIEDRGGVDTYNGGAGWDTVSYNTGDSYWDGWAVGIDANLKTGKVTGYDDKIDTLKNIESIRGTAFKDKFTGDKNDNEFMGYQGKDDINGAGGWDRASYRNDADRGGTDGIKADLKKGYVRDGFGQKDTIKNIEEIDGTDSNDVFIDNNKSNHFRGRDGDDKMTFSKGNDSGYGEEGADTFIFKGNNFGYDSIWDFDQDEGDKIKINNANSLDDLIIYQEGDHTVIKFNDNAFVQLDHIWFEDISASDFIF